MIKHHHLKWKIPKQDVVQVKNQTTSTFYIARRIIQSNNDRAMNVMNNKVADQIINYKKQIPSSSKTNTISNYRSYSTTPTMIKKQQQSENMDEQVQLFNTERHQSISILSSQFKINTLPKTNRVLSLYQISPQEEPKSSQFFDQQKHYYQSQFHSVKNVKLNHEDEIKINQYPNSNDIIYQNSIIMNTIVKNKTQIFINITYKEQSKYLFLQHQQGTQKQQIFIQKVLKNIKESQIEQTDSNLLVRKYSKIWKENFQQIQFQEQQKYSQSQLQFKLYFNQFIEKCLNKFRLYQQINNIIEQSEKNQIIEQQNENNIIQLHESINRKFYIENHNIKSTHTKIEDQQFRYKQEIISFGMIDILTEVKDDEFQSEYLQQQDSQEEISGKKLEYFQPQNKQFDQQYQISPIINKLDNQTKNVLLSVDYTDMDKIIYQNNIDEFVPNIQSDNIEIRRYISKIIYKKYSDILIGNYKNNNEIVDLEYNNNLQQQQQQITQNMDKKAMMMNLRKQTLESKVQTKVLGLQKDNRIIQKQFINSNYLLSPEQQNKINQNISENQIDQTNEIINTNDSNQGDLLSKYYKDKPVKYKQQLKLQNLQIFDNAIKQENSSIAVVQMMIEHNFIDELIDYLRKNPNFSLNSRNAEGKTLIMIAAQSGNKELVQYMINQNVLLNVKDLEGNTALHYSIIYGYYDIADLLLLNGANPQINNRNVQKNYNQKLLKIQ